MTHFVNNKYEYFINIYVNIHIFICKWLCEICIFSQLCIQFPFKERSRDFCTEIKAFRFRSDIRRARNLKRRLCWWMREWWILCGFSLAVWMESDLHNTNIFFCSSLKALELDLWKDAYEIDVFIRLSLWMQKNHLL